jgi:hypothetical protein
MLDPHLGEDIHRLLTDGAPADNQWAHMGTIELLDPLDLAQAQFASTMNEWIV